MKSKLSTLAFALAIVTSTSANAGVVTVWGEALSGFSLSTINNFYNGLPGDLLQSLRARLTRST